ncbi:MAG: hypothetical protein LBH64_05115 [Coriobacteriales bacterium]|jgi:hypothetical protein|nr:hypothetical protein [Coriobacteriales bacterium]
MRRGTGFVLGAFGFVLLAALALSLLSGQPVADSVEASAEAEGGKVADGASEVPAEDGALPADGADGASLDAKAGRGAASRGVAGGEVLGREGAEPGAVGREDVLAFSQEPPVALPSSLRPRGYERGAQSEAWRAVSDAPCGELARELLLGFRASGMRLVKADYLDLFGEAWGCVLEEEGRASLVCSLIPERVLRERDDSNLLQVTLVRTALPAWAQAQAERGDEREGDRELEAGEGSGEAQGGIEVDTETGTGGDTNDTGDRR